MFRTYRDDNSRLQHNSTIPKIMSVGKIFGSDERVRVSNTALQPYSAIMRLLIIVDGVEYQSTGFMIKPNVMLTAGHNIYDHSAQKYSDKVYVLDSVGMRHEVYDAVIPEEYKKYRMGTYDWAVAKVAVKPGQTFSTINIINMDGPNAPDVVNNSAEIAGFPVEVRDVTTSDMYTETGNIMAYDNADKLLNYKIDTSGGNSGSPVIVYIDTVPYAIGIHVRNSEDCNIARAIDDNIIRAINGI